MIVNANGNRTSLTYANGTTTTYAYNKANLVTSVLNKKGTTTLSSHSYTYYLDGNIASENENGTTKTYEYDGLGRLTKETKNGTITSYTYDLNGNRATMTQNGVTTVYEYDANNRLLKETVASAVTTYTYDNNGNLINAWNAGNPVGAYAYNLFGNQISFTADSIVYTNYTYRPDGLRHSIGDKVHIWDGANIVADVDGNDVTVYFRGVNLIYADDGDKTYYHFNAHGDVVVLTNSNGSKTKSYSYNAFGVEYNEATLDDNPFRYCGEYYDKETKTIYLRARYYNAELGRFTQEDPIRDGYNWYAYCNSNPLMFVDPTGQWAWLSKAVAIATTVAVAAIAVTAIVATAGAAAPAIGIGVGMAFGCSGAVASAVTTAATVGAYAVAGTIGAIAVSDSVEIATSDENGNGYNPIRDELMDGNQEAYDALKVATDIVADCIVEVGASAYSPNSYSFDNDDHNNDTTATNLSSKTSNVAVSSNANLSSKTSNVAVSSNANLSSKTSNVAVSSNTNLSPKVHGNSLNTTKPTQGYILRDIDTHEILKYGETTCGTKRYSHKYLQEVNAYMDFVASGTKSEMHQWQHSMIENYVCITGQRPPLNKSMW